MKVLLMSLLLYMALNYAFQARQTFVCSPGSLKMVSSFNENSIVADTSEAPKRGRTFYIETHGCQMNLADSEIVRSVLNSAGYEMGNSLEDADLILTNTCAIRENAEAKVWQRLKYFASLRKANKKRNREAKKAQIKLEEVGHKPDGYPIVGVLGCMAERLKTQLLEDAEVDFIAGPDAYRDLPNLLSIVDTTTDAQAANTALSLEETYADIQPVRLAEGNTHAFVTITRGCNNKCSFCVVPYTRGVERSRPVASILREVQQLRDEGFKEVVLLGQNVNSYYFNGDAGAGDGVGAEDRENAAVAACNVQPALAAELGPATNNNHADDEYLPRSINSETKVQRKMNLAEGFSQKWKPKPTASAGLTAGVTFAELLTKVAAVDPELRIRFQSPHPKDFPDEVLELIAKTPNICNSLHMPAQSGSTSMLERMHRGYSREAYLSLIDRARSIIAADTPECIGLGISSDFISGFCGETAEEHEDTISMLEKVQYDQAFTYSYSKREQTYAGLFYQDDVPEEIKGERLTELIDTFQRIAQERNRRLETGRLHVVLVEGEAKNKGKGKEGEVNETKRWTGRTDSNKRVVFPGPGACGGVLRQLTQAEADAFKELGVVEDHDAITASSIDKAILKAARARTREDGDVPSTELTHIEKGMYVIVKIVGNRGHTLRGAPVSSTTLTASSKLRL